jgi:hypothetical protein
LFHQPFRKKEETMTAPFSPEQLESGFMKKVVSLGLKKDQVEDGGSTADSLSYITANTAFKTMVTAIPVSVKDRSQLARMLGVPGGSLTGNEITSILTVPPPWESDSRKEPDETTLNHIERAMKLSMAGQHHAVASYEPVLDDRFPMETDVFAARDILVKKDTPLVILIDQCKPVFCAFLSLVLEPGAQVICRGQSFMEIWTASFVRQ